MKRRTFLTSSAGLAGLTLTARDGALAWTGTHKEGARVMTAAEFHASRRFAQTRFGRIAYVERGSGAAAALFIHGLPLNGFHWRGSIARISARRRCLAPDLLGLGYTETGPEQDLAPATQADMIAAFLDALSIETVDVVANDSGGAVAQLLAARHPARVRTLLLTNCDVHTNSPPKSIADAMEAARKGTLADMLARHLADKAFARSPEGLFAVCYGDPAKLTDEAIDCYLTPLLATPARRAQLHGYLLAFEPNPLPAIEPILKRSPVPVRIVWGTADIHFHVSWAEWLDRAEERAAQEAERVREDEKFHELGDCAKQGQLLKADDTATAFLSAFKKIVPDLTNKEKFAVTFKESDLCQASGIHAESCNQRLGELGRKYPTCFSLSEQASEIPSDFPKAARYCFKRFGRDTTEAELFQLCALRHIAIDKGRLL